MCNLEEKDALRTYHTQIGFVSLILIVFFLSCFMLAVLLYYLHYAVSHNHKQIYQKIFIVKIQEALKDITATETIVCFWKTLLFFCYFVHLDFELISLFQSFYFKDTFFS